MELVSFLIWKRAIFCQIKEIEHLSGGVVLYAAQTNALIDAELVKKGRFQTENLVLPKIEEGGCRQAPPFRSLMQPAN